MTRNEAIGLLSGLMFKGELKEALDMAIKALEQEPCDDAISRQDLREPRFIIAENDYQKGWNDALESVYENAPSIQPQPKMGRWIGDAIQGEIDGQIVKGFTCSKCCAISLFRIIGGKIVNGDLCPNCGAKMQEVEE